MREESLATWDGGNITWGGQARVYGTVPVCVCAQEIAGVRDRFWRENRYDIEKRSKVRMGIMPTETELTLEQTQQVTMEILLEPTSSKLLVDDVGDYIWIRIMTLDINLGPE
nr:hypothetical protein [Tanacetum cinerariifolium]